VSGAGSAAAASSAAIFGPALAASADQPAVSRTLTKATAPSPAISANSGASWVQPTVTGAPVAVAARKRSISARQS